AVSLSVSILFLMILETIFADIVSVQMLHIESRDLDSTISSVIKTIIRFLAGIADVILLAKLVFDGMKLMTSSGNPQTRTEAIHGIMWSLGGGIVAIGAYVFAGVIVGFVENMI